ncbi:MAG: hypothetical protein HY779_01135 [Rubrobacteridae bacterium]|nr:hypothetical protein [Rubrobacteridae bacterium]
MQALKGRGMFMIGATVPTIGGLHNAFKYADAWDCDCIQIYLTASRRWNSPPIAVEQKKLFFEAWKGSRVKEVISHVPFLVNVASPDKELILSKPWRGRGQH